MKKNKNKNKGGFFVLLLILLLPGFFGFVYAALASCENLTISEIMYDTVGSDTGNEWIELLNNSENSLVLEKSSSYIKNLKLKNNASVHNIFYRYEIQNIAPKEFFLLTNNTDFDALRKKYKLDPDMKIFRSAFSSLTNSGGIIGLSCDNGASFFDTLSYSNSWGGSENGKTLEKIDFHANDWQESFCEGGTPGKRNSLVTDCPPEIPPPPKPGSNKISINEIFPKPLKGSGQEEFVELYNSSDREEDLGGWKLKDRASYTCDLSGNKIGAKDFLVVTEAEIKKLGNKCTIALNDTTGETLALYDPPAVAPLSDVSYAGSAKENLSYNFDGSSWRWSKFLTPGEKNRFNNLPEVSKKKDQKIYAGVYADFSADGHDKDKDKLKFTWDFGDDHKSYLKKTRHKFKKAGKYKVTLKVSDGSEDKIETFNIKVEKFPESKVKIVSVSANPKGKDSDAEYIVLQNKSKKKINLKDWSVATGSKNLYNHPVTEDIIIKPGKTITLTREFSKFSLNNKKTKIELRYPNGKVASKLAYDKKTKSIAEDEIYTKESGQWAWAPPKTENKLALAAKPVEIVTPAVIEKEIPQEPKIILASGQNFSEDENLRKTTLENFAKPQGIVLGAAIFRPTFSNVYQVQPKNSFLEIIFSQLNFFTNYCLNNLSVFFN